MEKLKIEDLKKDLFLGDYGEYITEYNNGYISDVIHELTDSQIDIYNYNLFNWVAEDLNNIYYCDQAIQEFGANDIVGILQGAQMLAIEEDIYNNIENILMYWMYEYIESNLNISEITEEQREDLEVFNFASCDRFEEIEEHVNEILDDIEEE